METLKDQVGSIPGEIYTAVSVGAYDGIHRGHQQVLSTLADLAAERALAPAVVTFDQHPLAVLDPARAPLLLTDHQQRLELFESFGIEYLYLLAFDEDRAATTAQEFVAKTLIETLHAKLIVVGSDFHFGQGRSGSVESLREWGAELGFEVVDLDLLAAPEKIDGSEPISSTAIRSALATGDIATVNAMLGRCYEVRGYVSEGDRRGRTIGFPTANINYEKGRAWPGTGVYAAWATLADGRRFAAAVNVGMRPTFHESAELPVLEAHLLDFDEDIYGHHLAVEFVEFLRPEQRFDGVDALVAQLATDVERTRLILAE